MRMESRFEKVPQGYRETRCEVVAPELKGELLNLPDILIEL